MSTKLFPGATLVILNISAKKRPEGCLVCSLVVFRNVISFGSSMNFCPICFVRLTRTAFVSPQGGAVSPRCSDLVFFFFFF